MTQTKRTLTALAVLCGAAAFAPGSAQALTMQQCNLKYQQAKSVGAASAAKDWNSFRSSECGPDASPTAAAPAPSLFPWARPAQPAPAPQPTVQTAPAPRSLSMRECSMKYQRAKSAGTAADWNSFRAAECGPGATTATAQNKPLFPWQRPAQQAPATPQAAPQSAPIPPLTPHPSSKANPRYQQEGRQADYTRIRQCGAEWRASTPEVKASYGTWPRYWSACNTRLKTYGR